MRTSLTLAICVLILSILQPVHARDYKRVELLLESGQTVLGTDFKYPVSASPKVTAVIVSLLPGEETGWHTHDVPLFGYMLEGELTVDYGNGVTKTYRKNDALLEAVDHPHNGKNTGQSVMRVLAVFMADQDSLKTEKQPAPVQ